MNHELIAQNEIGPRPDGEALAYAERVLSCREPFTLPTYAAVKCRNFMYAATWLLVDAYADGRGASTSKWDANPELNRFWQILYEAVVYFPGSRRTHAVKCARVLDACDMRAVDGGNVMRAVAALPVLSEAS